MDRAYLLTTDELDELPPGVCPACTGLSPGISIDGETIMHCPVCQDTGKVTVEEADRWREEMRTTRQGRGRAIVKPNSQQLPYSRALPCCRGRSRWPQVPTRFGFARAAASKSSRKGVLAS
jgi:hypothetical protein